MNERRWRISRRLLAAAAAALLVQSGIPLPARGQDTVSPLPELVVYQDFENYPNTQESGFVSVLPPTTDSHEVIGGSASGVVDMTGTVGDYQNGMWQVGYRLQADTEYTLTFKYKIISMTPGTRFYMLARSDTAGFAEDRYVFFDGGLVPADRSDSGDWYNFSILDKGEYQLLRFSFRNNDRTDRYLMWGVNGTGRAAIDDVALHTGHAGLERGMGSPVAQSAAKTAVTQDFEDDAANMALSMGGQAELIRTDPINGAASLSGKSGPEWTFAETRSSQVPIRSGDIHTVTFKMKKRGSLAAGEFYHFTAMSPTGRNESGFASDRYFRWNDSGQIVEAGTGGLANLAQLRCFVADAGGYWFVKLTFYVDGYADYVLQWGINSQNAENRMIVDDIRVFYGKDYTEDVPVPVFREGFENHRSAGGIGLFPAGGSYLYNEDAVISGSYSYRASGGADGVYTKALSSGALSLRPSSTYTVFLRFSQAQLLSAGGFFQLALQTAAGGYLNDAYLRFDASGGITEGNQTKVQLTRQGDVYSLAATFSLKDYTDYQLAFYVYGQGGIVVDDWEICAGTFCEPQPAQPGTPPAPERIYHEDFEGRQQLFELKSGSYGIRGEALIDGAASLQLRAHPDAYGYTIAASSRRELLGLEARGVYTVSMRYRFTAETAPGGYAMLALRTNQGGPAHDRYIRFTPAVPLSEGNALGCRTDRRGGESVVEAVFVLDDYSDYRLELLFYGDRGALSVDDVAVFRGAAAQPVPAAAPSPRSDPQIEESRILEEDFEHGGAVGQSFYLRQGAIVFDEGTIVNGSFSLAMKAPAPGQWMDGMVSDIGRLPLIPGKTYSVRFRFRQWVDAAGAGFIQAAARVPGGDGLSDSFVRFTPDGGYVDGNAAYELLYSSAEYKTAVFAFTASAQGMELVFSAFGQGGIFLDDLAVYESTAYSYSTAAPVIRVPEREVGAKDYAAPEGGGLYRIPDGTVPPYAAPRSDSVDFDGEGSAEETESWREEISTKETVTREEPYEEVIATDAVTQKVVRRLIPKGGALPVALIAAGAALAAAVIGAGIFLLIRRKRRGG